MKHTIVTLLCALFLTAGTATADTRSNGHTVYVPVYSHIYSGNQARPFNLAATLSIRNTDLKESITISAVDYYNTAGKLVKRHLSTPLLLAPLSAKNFFVQEADTSGGSGASFLVRWSSARPANQPIIESVMIGTQTQQGISFTSRGQIIE